MPIKFAAIFVLLRCRRPSAIFGRVVSVVVDAIDRCSWRFFAHVGEKVFKFVPALADFDAAAAVVFVIFFPVFVATAGSHVHPGAKGCGPLTAGGVPVLAIVEASEFETSARLCVAAQIRAADDCLFAASATTFPKNSPSGAVREANGSQLSVCASGSIDKARHINIIEEQRT